MLVIHSTLKISSTVLRFPTIFRKYCGGVSAMTGKLAVIDPETQITELNGHLDEASDSERAWKEIKIPVPWGHVSGKWWGPSSVQPVLALHGWQDNAGTWDNLMPLLPHNIPVLAIDLPGHGLSSHYSKGTFYYLSWDGALLLRRIVKHFGWRPITILGHSLGGIIGFMYSSLFPDGVEKLIQIDIANPTIRPHGFLSKKSGDIIDKFLKYEDLTEADQPNYNYEDMLDIVVDAYDGSVDRESCKVLMKRGMAPNPSGNGYLFARDVRLKVAGIGFLSHDQVMELAESVRCKLLNIRALPLNSFDKPGYYTEVLDTIRKNAQVEYHEVEGTHHIHLNTPGKIANIVAKFLQS